VQPARRRVAQLVNVHSVLRLNYETLRGLISLTSPSVAKLTVLETGLRAPLCSVRVFPQSPVSALKSIIGYGVSAVAALRGSLTATDLHDPESAP
jgi:hypothetical protein